MEMTGWVGKLLCVLELSFRKGNTSLYNGVNRENKEIIKVIIYIGNGTRLYY